MTGVAHFWPPPKFRHNHYDSIKTPGFRQRSIKLADYNDWYSTIIYEMHRCNDNVSLPIKCVLLRCAVIQWCTQYYIYNNLFDDNTYYVHRQKKNIDKQWRAYSTEHISHKWWKKITLLIVLITHIIIVDIEPFANWHSWWAYFPDGIFFLLT